MSSCIYCGSRDIIYDTHAGYMICCSCGSVLETIYESETEAIRRLRISVDTAEKRSKRSKTYGSSMNIGHIYRAYRRVIGTRKLRKGVIIRNDAIISIANKARFYKLFTHVRDSVIEDLLDRSPVLRKVLDILRDYPSLYSRTTRGKIATAYIVAKIALNDPIIYGQVSKFFGLSRVHIRRIKNVVERARDLIAKVSVIEDLSKELTSIDHMISEYLGRVGRDAS
jgi:transcription initiation factor TFIIIB Brf1 subunit/transcription initiation factor TFIIB